jgi:hypothetical protein
MPINIKFIGALACALAPSVVYPAVLLQVPMQGGMVMPMVAFHAEHGHLHVMMPDEVPQLTPLLVSHPGDSFDPADPWFEALDPSRQGRSFSRRYGFVMDANSDPIPPDTQMWIRKLSGPAELKFYRYSASAPKAFEPIFGTEGANDAMPWNGMMFHPLVTAPPGTNSYTATFEVVLVDRLTGQVIPDSSSGPLTFNFTNVPDGRPTLSVAQAIVIAWPADTGANWVLESASSVDATDWVTVTNAPIVLNGRPAVVLGPEGAQRAFRMRLQP